MGQGFTTRMGIKAQASFTTAVAVTNIVPFLSESLKREKPEIPTEYLSGISGARKGDWPIQHVAGEISGEAVVDAIATDPIGWEHFIYGALGSAAWQSAQTLNRYTVADTLPSFTIAELKRSGVVWENIGCKINTFSLTGSATDQKLVWTAGILGYKQLITGDVGITNTSSTFTSLTPTVPSKMLFAQTVIRLGDTTDALAVADQINVREFTLNINNNLEDPVFATPDNTTHTNAAFPMEFIRNGLREVTLNLVLPRYAVETFLAAHLAGTMYQCDIVTTVGSDFSRILLPYIAFSGIEAPVGGAEIFGQTLSFKCYYNDGQNTMMKLSDSASNVTGEIAWEVNSNRTAIPD